MSYDLMVFDPLAPSPDRVGFLRWYGEQVTWKEGQSYDNPDINVPALQAWFLDMRKEFPPLNGPFRSDDVDNPKITDYSVGESIIYASFRWDEASSARAATFKLAKKHRVGFFDVSTDDGGVWLPDSAGNYSCVHGKGARKWWPW